MSKPFCLMPHDLPSQEARGLLVNPCVVHRGSVAEAEGCTQELAALVEHPLLNYLVRPEQQSLRDRQAKGVRCSQVDD
jgi:hypothetical protein